MMLEVTLGGVRYRVILERAVSLAIALDFEGAQVNCFGAAPARMNAMQSGAFQGKTRAGGSCNVPEIQMNPHCNGTHTESVAHLVDDSVAVHSMAPPLCPATLVSITPVSAAETKDSYTPAFSPPDHVIDAQCLEQALAEVPLPFMDAVVIRTLPNAETKRHTVYRAEQPPAFFTRQAAQYLRKRGVRHLVVDLPSIDRMSDEGRLTAHHVFFDLPEGARTLSNGVVSEFTVTELCFVPDAVLDGPYLLNLQLPAFELDVAPSRPLLLPLEPA